MLMSSADAAAPAARHSLLGSLKDALAAASRDDTNAATAKPASPQAATPPPLPVKPAQPTVGSVAETAQSPAGVPSAADAARQARGVSGSLEDWQLDADRPPTTRVIRGPSKSIEKLADETPRTTLVRGKVHVQRGTFEQDPVVAWLVVVGGPGMGQYRPVFEGNNTLGRAKSNRIPIDFGDDAISAEEQAYIRYDSSDRSFLFVPNLAKTNVVSVNDRRPTSAVELQAMDVITIGRTQLVFVPFCGPEFDWSALVDG
jgi:hypothetical protein